MKTIKMIVVLLISSLLVMSVSWAQTQETEKAKAAQEKAS